MLLSVSTRANACRIIAFTISTLLVAMACGPVAAQSVQGFLLSQNELQTISLGTAQTETVAQYDDDRYVGLSLDADSNLWTVDTTDRSLVQLSTTTGAVVSSTPITGITDLTAPDLSFGSCGDLWISTTQAADGDLYRLDPVTGNAVLIGNAGIPIVSLTSIDSRLVALTFNQTTGESSFVDLDRSDAQPFRFRPIANNATQAWVDYSEQGTLWGVSALRPVGPQIPGSTWTINPNQGERTIVAQSFDIDTVRGFALAPTQGLCQDELCTPGPKRTCFQNQRFSATVDWRTESGETGSGDVAPVESNDSAIFTFFDEDNWEIMLKVLDGCDINGHYWVYSAGSTDVEFTLVVTDLTSQQTRTVSSPLGVPAVTVNDTSAFPCS